MRIFLKGSTAYLGTGPTMREKARGGGETTTNIPIDVLERLVTEGEMALAELGHELAPLAPAVVQAFDRTHEGFSADLEKVVREEISRALYGCGAHDLAVGDAADLDRAAHEVVDELHVKLAESWPA